MTESLGLAPLRTQMRRVHASPLSVRKTMLAALLLDAHADEVFAAGETGAEDVLAYRAEVARRSPAMGIVFALCALKPDGPRLAVETVDVPIAEYPTLSVQDLMVSLYNGHSVQRVRIVMPDGSRHVALDVLDEAMGFWG